MRLILLLALGCASNSASTPTPPIAPKPFAPKWVEKKVTYENGVLFTVGEVSRIRNHELASSTASNWARAEISKNWDIFTAHWIRAFIDSYPESDRPLTFSCAIRDFLREFLNQVEIVDQWERSDGTFFSRGRLDLRSVASSLVLNYQLEGDKKARIEKAVDAAYAEVAGVPPGTYSKLAVASQPVQVLAANAGGCR
jgi:hypothetical protein